MAPYKNSIKPRDRYFVYCIDPTHGSCTFVVELDEKFAWFAEQYPPFIASDLLSWIGERIEFKTKQELDTN